jgi:hypothetical protein
VLVVAPVERLLVLLLGRAVQVPRDHVDDAREERVVAANSGVHGVHHCRDLLATKRINSGLVQTGIGVKEGVSE